MSQTGRDFIDYLIAEDRKGLCHKRIAIDGCSDVETYCMKERNHSGDCEKVTLAPKQKKTFREVAEELYLETPKRK